MKAPNTYGAIIFLGKGRRKPYALRVTDYEAQTKPDKDGIYRRKYKYIGYYATKLEAYEARARYNEGKTPSDYINITFKQVWDIWAERNLEKGSKSRIASYNAAIKKCEPIYNKKMTALRLHDLQTVVDLYSGASKSSLNNIKIVMSFIFEWAVKNDIISKDYSQYVEVDARQVENHTPFTHAETNKLIQKENHTLIEKICIIYLFTGVRPSELLELKKEDCHIAEQYFHIRKSKTKSGIRLVPIADKIVTMFTDIYNSSTTENFIDISYKDYKDSFKQIFPTHTPHDTRSTFISFLTELDVQQIIIQKIVGHSNGTVTGDVYTKLSLAPLLTAVNKL